jgi:hypothetical protein
LTGKEGSSSNSANTTTILLKGKKRRLVGKGEKGGKGVLMKDVLPLRLLPHSRGVDENLLPFRLLPHSQSFFRSKNISIFAFQKILDSFNRIFLEMGSISGLAVSQTAHSVDHSIPFPFMTMTNFQEKAGNARALSGALYVSISNIVAENQLAAYDDFVLGPDNAWMYVVR